MPQHARLPNATLSGQGEHREPLVRCSVKFDAHLIFADFIIGAWGPTV
jgi:hypothetical protein